jgi:hypothetical protein
MLPSTSIAPAERVPACVGLRPRLNAFQVAHDRVDACLYFFGRDSARRSEGVAPDRISRTPWAGTSRPSMMRVTAFFMSLSARDQPTTREVPAQPRPSNYRAPPRASTTPGSNARVATTVQAVRNIAVTVASLAEADCYGFEQATAPRLMATCSAWPATARRTPSARRCAAVLRAASDQRSRARTLLASCLNSLDAATEY